MDLIYISNLIILFLNLFNFVYSNNSYCYSLQNGVICFMFVNQKTVDTGVAYNICSTPYGMHLLEIRTKEIQDLFEDFQAKYLTNSDRVPYLLNLNVNTPSNWIDVDGSPNTVTIDGQTDGSNILRYAKLIYNRRRLNVESPTTLLKFVCTDGQVQNSNLSWYEARYECLNKNQDLLIVNDLSKLPNLPPGEYWVGLYRELWVWKSTDQNIKFSNWRSDSPKSMDNGAGNKRVLMEADLQWNNVNPQDAFVVCMNETFENTQTATSSMNSAIDPYLLVSKSSNTQDVLTTRPPDNATIIGLAVGIPLAVILLIIIIVVVVVCTRRKRQSHQYEKPNLDANKSNSNSEYAEINEIDIKRNPEYAEVAPQNTPQSQPPNVDPYAIALNYVELATNPTATTPPLPPVPGSTLNRNGNKHMSIEPERFEIKDGIVYTQPIKP